MTLLDLIKHLHVWCVTLSVLFFFVRLSWQRQNNPMLGRRLIKLLPHLVDTILAITGVCMVWLLSYHRYMPDWLIIKLVLLAFYIGFGWMAMNLPAGRKISISITLACLAGMILLAISKPFF